MTPKYWRSKNITGHFDKDGKVASDLTVAHSSINAAKRASRELQGSQLGQGSLVVVRR